MVGSGSGPGPDQEVTIANAAVTVGPGEHRIVQQSVFAGPD
jgi:hypothetical protein